MAEGVSLERAHRRSAPFCSNVGLVVTRGYRNGSSRGRAPICSHNRAQYHCMRGR